MPNLILKQMVKPKSTTITRGMLFEKYKKVFSKLDQIDTHKIPDPISESPINTKIYILKHAGDVIGFAREIHTTTGCNSECLPINYTAFYYPDGKYLKLHSTDGLTKIGHALFTNDDLIKLSYLIELAPMAFDKIVHPTDLTDALTGATLKEYQNIVVKGAAYSTLRIHLYHQDSLKFIKRSRIKR